MKKYLGCLVLALLLMIPLAVHAAPKISADCTTDDTGIKTCVISYDFDEELETVTVTLTEKGGAEVTSVSAVTGSDWEVSYDKSTDNVWEVTALSIGISGTGKLFEFTYVPSGEEDCTVSISLNGATIPTEDDTPDPDEPTPQKQTGSTLPFIAVGTLALVAGGAYISTKNKAKMYKI